MHSFHHHDEDFYDFFLLCSKKRSQLKDGQGSSVICLLPNLQDVVSEFPIRRFNVSLFQCRRPSSVR